MDKEKESQVSIDDIRKQLKVILKTPKLNFKGFACPFCNVYAHQEWYDICTTTIHKSDVKREVVRGLWFHDGFAGCNNLVARKVICHDSI